MSSNDEIIDALEALFAAVVAKARADKAFARQLAMALGDPKKLLAPTGGHGGVATPDVDPRAVFAADGADGLRKALTALNRRELEALVRAHGLAPEGSSRLGKTEVIEHVVRTLLRQGKPQRSAFDY